ncbi:OmpP1/FadL family transporter [Accumulibacter sp.]|uniref:OmpP1/FadL family transporter n=1 Tax=Accumulibacter sp. TaxID=2053492 RepID=UPI0025D9EB79|nr:outer membrane protein transport protein [Accumulibacter sp.]MCM8595631.1 outer membrane protein transport protein [Accumulibacter sp.]MCM8626050.1 outer membrane protein transport protein [Accumulibacter sp.]MDS4049778.1 outer membrane protein transport protein [Accumulibacter sp.]
MRSGKHGWGGATLRLWAIAVAGLALLPANAARAGGLLLYEVGTADVGLASAGYSARAQDASTVLTNPAGMTRLPGTQILLGAQALYGDYGFSRGAGTDPLLGGNHGGNPIGWFPGGGFFLTHRLSPEVALGLAVTGNFGLAVKYDADWVGRYYGQQGTLLGLSLLPSVAWKVNDKLSLGASLNAMYGGFKQKVAINNVGFGRPDGQLEMDDRTWGFGVNLGLLYEIDPATRLGLTWNSQVNLDFSAQPSFSGVSPGLALLLAARGLDRANIDVGIKVPQGVLASVFHQVDERWAVLGSIGWQQWSKFGDLELGISDNRNPGSLTANLDFKDTWHVAVGGQYRVSQPWLLNFGVAYDSAFQDNPIASPLLPANSAWRFGVGFQNEVDRSFSWGAAAEYVYGGTIDLARQARIPLALGGRGNLDGSYDNAGIFFLSANFNWKF